LLTWSVLENKDCRALLSSSYAVFPSQHCCMPVPFKTENEEGDEPPHGLSRGKKFQAAKASAAGPFGGHALSDNGRLLQSSGRTFILTTMQLEWMQRPRPLGSRDTKQRATVRQGTGLSLIVVSPEAKSLNTRAALGCHPAQALSQPSSATSPGARALQARVQQPGSHSCLSCCRFPGSRRYRTDTCDRNNKLY